MATYEYARIQTAARAVGTAQAALRGGAQVRAGAHAVRPAHRRVPGHPPQAGARGRRRSKRRASSPTTPASKKDSGARADLEAGMAKVFAAEMAERVTSEMMQVFGGYGYSREYPAQRFWRDARVFRIFEGTSEIQYEVIAKRLLGREVTMARYRASIRTIAIGLRAGRDLRASVGGHRRRRHGGAVPGVVSRRHADLFVGGLARKRCGLRRSAAASPALLEPRALVLGARRLRAGDRAPGLHRRALSRAGISRRHRARALARCSASSRRRRATRASCTCAPILRTSTGAVLVRLRAQGADSRRQARRAPGAGPRVAGADRRRSVKTVPVGAARRSRRRRTGGFGPLRRRLHRRARCSRTPSARPSASRSTCSSRRWCATRTRCTSTRSTARTTRSPSSASSTAASCCRG